MPIAKASGAGWVIKKHHPPRRAADRDEATPVVTLGAGYADEQKEQPREEVEDLI